MVMHFKLINKNINSSSNNINLKQCYIKTNIKSDRRFIKLKIIQYKSGNFQILIYSSL